MKKAMAVLTAWCCAGTQMVGQQPFVARPRSPIFWRPYLPSAIPPARMTNSDHLHNLIRGGRLYLTLQDAIALAIENNLNLEIDRYGPLLAEWGLERAEAGGALPGIPNANTLLKQPTSGQGVAGAIQSAGLSSNNAGNLGGNANTQITQIGPITPNLDTVFQNLSGWSRLTTPQSNSVISGTDALIDTTHVYNSTLQQGLLTGGLMQLAVNESYLRENSPNDALNPSFAPSAQIMLRHNLLSGFGTAVNRRFIRVAENQIPASRGIFRSQLVNLVAKVADLYWDLVSAHDDLKAKEQARDIAQKFLDGTRARIRLGEIAGFEVFRAQAELSARNQEVAIAEATVRQNANVLKDALSRDGLADPLLDEAEVVPLDRIPLPESDDLPPLRELVARALAQRPDIALAKVNGETQRVSALGTQSGILPYLQATVTATANAVAGTPNPGQSPSPQTVGGLGTAFGQILKGDFTSRRATVVFQGALGNHVAQADYGIDQLQIAQSDLMERRSMNQLVVDISNQMIALRQARSRYLAAVDTRVLQEQLLDKVQQQFTLGGTTIDGVVGAARSLAAARYTEVAMLASYSHARVALDQVLGQTLEANHVSLDDALKGVE